MFFYKKIAALLEPQFSYLFPNLKPELSLKFSRLLLKLTGENGLPFLCLSFMIKFDFHFLNFALNNDVVLILANRSNLLSEIEPCVFLTIFLRF